MTQPTEPQAPAPAQSTDTVPVTAQWITIYENDTATVSVLLRGNSVTRLLVNTEETLPLSFAVFALKRWNTDDRRHFKLDPDQWVKTYWSGTQPRYETTVETTFRDLEWTVIPGQRRVFPGTRKRLGNPPTATNTAPARGIRTNPASL